MSTLLGSMLTPVSYTHLLLHAVAADLNIGMPTVSDWMKGKEKLIKFSAKPGSGQLY